MTLKDTIERLCTSRDGKLAEPAKIWLEHSFYSVFFCMIIPLIFVPVSALYRIPFLLPLFFPQITLAGLLTWFLLRDDPQISPRVKLQFFTLQPFPFLMMIKAFLILVFCTIILSSAMMKLSAWMGYDLPQQALVSFLMKADGIQTAAVVFSAIIIAPVLEEWAFRRVIFGKLATLVSCPLAMILTSFLFSIMHGNILHAPSLFVMGMILQGVMRRTSSIICPIILHAAFNLLNIVMLLITVHFKQ